MRRKWYWQCGIVRDTKRIRATVLDNRHFWLVRNSPDILTAIQEQSELKFALQRSVHHRDQDAHDCGLTEVWQPNSRSRKPEWVISVNISAKLAARIEHLLCSEVLIKF